MKGTSRATRALLAGALVMAALGSGAVAVVLANQLGSTAAWWPAAGVGVITLLLMPRRWWPQLLVALGVAYTLANLVGGRDVVTASLLGLFDVLETAVIGQLLLRYVGRHLDGINGMWRMLVIALTGAVVAGLGIAGTLSVVTGDSFWSLFIRTVPSHAASVMLLTPLVMTRRLVRSPSWIELVTQVSAMSAVTLVTFGPGNHLTVAFAPLPFLVWAAVRFGERIVAIEQAVFAVTVTAFTWLGWGPFPAEPETLGVSTSNQLAQLYLLCIVLTGLPLAVAARQRDSAMTRLAASEEVFRRNFSESRVAIAILRWDGEQLRFAETNDSTYAILQRSSQDLAGREVTEMLVADELETVVPEIAAGVRGGWSGRVGVVEHPRTRVEATLSPIQELDASWYFSLHLTDVTEAAEFQARLQAEKDYTRAVIETASSMIVVTTLDGTVIAANPATTQATGFSEAELLGKRVWDLIIPDHRRATVSSFFGENGSIPREGEALLLTRTGEQRTVVYSGASHRAGPDAPVHYVLSATDVTVARENAGMVSHLLRSATTIAFVSTDLDGRIILFNSGAEHMLGLQADEARGLDFVDFLDPEELARQAAVSPHRTAFAAIVGSAGIDSAPETRDWTFVTKDRAPRRVSMTTNPVTDTFGQLFGYLFVARDVTDTRRSQEVLVKALRREREVVARLKDLDRAKDDFVSTVSHELRTPMSSIIGSAEMLSDGMVGKLIPEQQRMVDVIARNGDRLLALADDLLLLAAFDAGTWQHHSARVDMADVIDASASLVLPMVASRDLELDIRLPEQPVVVLGDPVNLERAVTNLLSNAVKFTSDGGRIRISVCAEDDQRTAVVSVSDTGLGIPEDELEAVFAKFFRSAVVQEQAIQGSGLGLAIVKTIVESHDGRIDVRSRAGEGSTFTIRLPHAQPLVALESPTRGSPRRSRP